MVSFSAFHKPEKIGIGQTSSILVSEAFRGACNTPLGLLYLRDLIPQASLAIGAGVVAGAATYQDEGKLSTKVVASSIGATIVTAVATASTVYVTQASKDIGHMNDYADSFTKQQEQGIAIEDMHFAQKDIRQAHLDFALSAMERERSYQNAYDQAYDAYHDNLKAKGLTIFDVGFEDMRKTLPTQPSQTEVEAQPLLNPSWTAQDEAIFRSVADQYHAIDEEYHRLDERRKGEDYWQGIGTNYGRSTFLLSMEHEGTINDEPDLAMEL